MTPLPLRILSTGKALPPIRMSAEDVDEYFGFKRGYTFAKGGVQVRHFAKSTDTQSALAARALHDALARADLTIDSIDLLISACGVPEQVLPSMAGAIAAASGLPAGTATFDVNSSCLSFLTAMQVAAGMLAAGTYRRIAVVSCDFASRGLDWREPEASLIFGDGAACAIVEEGDGLRGIEAFKLSTYPEGRSFCEIRAGGTMRNPRAGVEDQDFMFRMNGKAVFKMVSKLMPDFIDDLLSKANIFIEDVDLVVPHQASHLGLAHLTKRLSLPASRVVNIYETHGNQVAASLPTALHEAFVTGRAAPRDRLLLVGTGAGLTLGGMLVTL